jgi:hypothetical protein
MFFKSLQSFSNIKTNFSWEGNFRLIDGRDHIKSSFEKKSFLFFTCEHASNQLPTGYTWSNRDVQNFVSTHWSYDIK